VAVLCVTSSSHACLVSAATLFAMNRLYTELLDRVPALQRRLVGEPVVLINDGHVRRAAMRRQGVTTEVLGEGQSAGPYKGQLSPRRVTVRGQEYSWDTLGGYFDTLEKAGVAVNVASYVGMDNVWQAVMGPSHERPTAEQREQMKALVDAAMKDGAVGLSTMLAMPPGSLATTDDLVEMCKVVARHGGLYSTHNRNEGSEVFAAVKEAIAIGERAGVPVDVIHLKIADQKLWGRMNELVALIDEARKRGVNVQANVYPYTRGNNDLASIIPPWAHEGGTAKVLERLKDAKQRERMKKDIREGIPGWYNHFTAVGGDFFVDPLPKVDVITMGMILHDWNLEKKRTLIRKVYDALPEGGAFVVIEALIDDARRANAFGLLMSLNMLIEFGDAFDYSGSDFASWCREAGFRHFEIIPLTGPSSAAVAYK